MVLLCADAGRGLLVREEIEDQLTHTLLVIRLKLQEFHPDQQRLDGANHGRVDFDIGLAGGSMHDQFDKRASRKRGGGL